MINSLIRHASGDIYRRSGATLPRAACTLIGLLTLLLAPLHAGAQANSAYDKRTVGMLPGYCKADIGYAVTPEEKQHWRAQLGSGFDHIHHYCRGQESTNFAIFAARDKKQRDFKLRYALREYDYVLNNARADFKLMPEVHLKKAENLVRLSRDAEAIPHLHQAMALRPDYWPPYGVMSDIYKGLGDRAQARAWAERGLAAAPDTKALKARLAELGGPAGGGNSAAPAPSKSPKPPARAPQPETTEAPGEQSAQSPPAER